MSNFPRIVPLQSCVMNASLYSCSLRILKQEQTFYPGRPNSGNLSVCHVTFETEVANFENDIVLPPKTAIESKQMSSCRKKNCVRNNAHNFFTLSLVFLKLLIVGVAFFLGHPV